MGIREFFGLKPASNADYDPDDNSPLILHNFIGSIHRMPAEQLWEEQPHLRTVVDFMARQVSSVSLHSYVREGDNSRVRDRDSVAALLCKKVNPNETMSTLLNGSVHDLCLYDEFIWYVKESVDAFPEIYRIPPSWVLSYHWENAWTLSHIRIQDKNGQILKVDGDRLIRHHGYAPKSTKFGVSPIDALRDILREQLESAAYRSELWRNGPRISGVITRPRDANWDNKARQRFKRSWNAQYSGRGSGAGGTPLLEDGMDFKPMHLKATDEQIVDVAKLSLQTVASIYHIPPTMVGLLDNANYSNVKEFRKSLYGEALGPVFKILEETLNLFLLPAIEASLDLEGVYLEFNLDEKLRASFEERAAVTSTAVGGPFMTVNEARAQHNLPMIEGGDDLLRPLNLGTSTDSPDEKPDDEPESEGDA